MLLSPALRQFFLFITLLVVGPVAGCGSPSGPSSVPAPAPSGATYIRGGVFDTVNRPVAGARVEILDGPHAGASAIAGDRGAFEFVGTTKGRVRLRGSRDGFESTTINAEWTTPGDPHQPGAGITLKTLEPDLPIVPGPYTVTFVSDRSTAVGHYGVPCTGFPADLLQRTYEASISQATRFHGFEVRFAGPALQKFPFDFGWGFGLIPAGPFVGVELESGFGSGPTEVYPDFRYLMIGGVAPTSEPAIVTESSITIPFWGTFSYCRLNSDLSPANHCSQVPGEQMIEHYTCSSPNDKIVFTKR
jgi:hypothetical protein